MTMLASEMLKDKIEAIGRLIEESDLTALKEWLDVHPADIAEFIRNLSTHQSLIIFRLLSKDTAVEVYEHLDVDEQSKLLESFLDERITVMVNAMSPDDRARLFDELPATVVQRLLKHMTQEEWQATSVLLGFKEDTAGRLMTPEYVALKSEMTVEEALDWIKHVGHEKETIYSLYVIDNTRHLIGVVSLRDIVLSENGLKISDKMDSQVIKVSTEDDQEMVANITRDYDLLAVPVVDKENRLVGIVTVDDIVDVIEEETTEDILRMSGVEMAERGYFKSDVIKNFNKRIVWLLFLLGLNTLTGNIIIGQKKVMESMVVLSAFIPVLIGSGGNAGSQSSTIVIRALATGEIDTKDFFRILSRELALGLGIGAVLGIAITIWAFWLQGEWDVALVVGLSLLTVITLATTLGTLLPLIVKRIGFDPAFMATPFITTAIDVTALLIYFKIARSLLNI